MFVALCFVFGGLYAVALGSIFGINDDFFVHWPVGRVGFVHPLSVADLLYGRPLDAVLKTLQYYTFTIKAQWIIRLIAVGLIAVIGVVLVRNLVERCRVPYWPAVLLVFVILALPGFQVFVVWATAFVALPAMLLGLSAALIAEPMLDRLLSTNPLRPSGISARRSIGAVVVLLCGMYIYPPTAVGYAIVPLAALLFRAEKTEYGRVVRFLGHVVVIGVASAIYVFSVRWVILPIAVAHFYIHAKSADYIFRIGLDILQKFIVLRDLEFTALNFWWDPGFYGHIGAVRIARFVFLLGLGSHLFARIAEEAEKPGMKIRVFCALGECLAIVALTYIVANSANLAAQGHVPYTRHVVIFSVSYLLVYARALQVAMAYRWWNSPVNAAVTTATGVGLALMVAYLLFSNVGRAVKIQTEDWQRTVAAVAKADPIIKERGVTFGVIMSNIPGGRFEIMGATTTWRTHAFLILFAAFDEAGGLEEGYRYRPNRYLLTDNIGKALRLTFRTRYGTGVTADYVFDKSEFPPGMNYDVFVDYRH